MLNSSFLLVFDFNAVIIVILSKSGSLSVGLGLDISLLNSEAI